MNDKPNRSKTALEPIEVQDGIPVYDVDILLEVKKKFSPEELAEFEKRLVEEHGYNPETGQAPSKH